jgi:hypothetical protein
VLLELTVRSVNSSACPHHTPEAQNMQSISRI